MTEFDPVRAISEEIAGLSDVRIAIRVREREAEDMLGKAESYLNAMRKLGGFADSELDRKRAIRDELIRKRDEGNK